MVRIKSNRIKLENKVLYNPKICNGSYFPDNKGLQENMRANFAIAKFGIIRVLC